MASNVLSWKSAVGQNLNPSLYSFLFDDVPLGEYLAKLDFKIWAKKVMAINCYFTLLDSEKKIQLTVYCNEAGTYRAGNSEVNFATCSLNMSYRIKVIANQKKKIVLVHAELMP